MTEPTVGSTLEIAAECDSAPEYIQFRLDTSPVSVTLKPFEASFDVTLYIPVTYSDMVEAHCPETESGYFGQLTNFFLTVVSVLRD